MIFSLESNQTDDGVSFSLRVLLLQGGEDERPHALGKDVGQRSAHLGGDVLALDETRQHREKMPQVSRERPLFEPRQSLERVNRKGGARGELVSSLRPRAVFLIHTTHTHVYIVYRYTKRTPRAHSLFTFTQHVFALNLRLDRGGGNTLAFYWW